MFDNCTYFFLAVLIVYGIIRDKNRCMVLGEHLC